MMHNYLFALAISIALSFALSACSGNVSGREEPSSSAALSSSSEAVSSSSSSGSSSSLSSSSSDSAEPSSSSEEVSSSSTEQSSSSSSKMIDGDFETVFISDGTYSQIWMKRNLNIIPTAGANDASTKSWCYEDSNDYCNEYGRLYDWATAMAFPEKCNSVSSNADEDCKISPVHQGICPSGFHVPSNQDWNKLFRIVDGSASGNFTINYMSIAGKFLKAKEGWDDCGEGKSSECEDTFGFAALPGGWRKYDGSSVNIGKLGVWWTASQYDGDNYYAYDRFIHCASPLAQPEYTSKTGTFSVRCIKDE